jgi:hypothetical protein
MGFLCEGEWRRRHARSGTNGNSDIDMAVVSHIDAHNGTLVNISGDQHNYYIGRSTAETPGEWYDKEGNSRIGSHDVRPNGMNIDRQ